jgi:hypothetical protein
MCLRDILVSMVETEEPVLLNDGIKDWEASLLLENLSEPRLKTPAYLQKGLYIAEINSKGLLGQVLFRIKHRDN